jgi:hypothetical protein
MAVLAFACCGNFRSSAEKAAWRLSLQVILLGILSAWTLH